MTTCVLDESIYLVLLRSIADLYILAWLSPCLERNVTSTAKPFLGPSLRPTAAGTYASTAGTSTRYSRTWVRACAAVECRPHQHGRGRGGVSPSAGARSLWHWHWYRRGQYPWGAKNGSCGCSAAGADHLKREGHEGPRGLSRGYQFGPGFSEDSGSPRGRAQGRRDGQRKCFREIF
eukprot:6214766-Pleurochrysis_carterae.AAC.1